MTGAEFGSAWVVAKIVQGCAALVGGLSMSIMWLPKRLMAHGKVIGIMLAGGLSALAGVAFTGIVAAHLEVDTKNLDSVIGTAMLVGACWTAFLNLLANSFSKREDQTLEEAVTQLRGKAKSEPTKSAPAKRPTAKKVPGKRVVRKVLNK
jgi:hypothetical protein